jgi:tripartite-type tricarboxylate transporter receptor subunit TctC
MRMIVRALGFMVGVFLLTNGVAFSQQDYPAKPVTIIHGISAGGQTDLSVRVLGDALSRLFNQPFVTIVKSGGAQTIAVSYVARSAPDGYTIGHFYQGVFSTTPYLQEIPYKFEDLMPVIGWQMSPQMLVCRRDAPYKDLKELVAAAKTQTISFGHNGKGSATFMVPTVFAKYAGIKLNEVPFKGDPEQVAAVLGGHVKLGTLTEVAARPLLESGEIRGLVNFAPQRTPNSPEIPTFKEQGFNIPIGVPVGMIFVPRGTPAAVIRKLHDGIKQSIADPKAKAEFAKLKQTLFYVDAKGMFEIIEKEKEICYPILKDAGLAK